MKVLWLVNLPLPDASRALGLRVADTGSWMTGQVNGIKRHPEIELTVLAPSSLVEEEKTVHSENVTYRVYPLQNEKDGRYFADTLATEKPDVIHIFGTEQKHSLEMMCVADPARAVISIQGLVYVYAGVYRYGMPARYGHKNPLKMLMKRLYCAEVVRDGQQQFERAGEDEKKALLAVRQVIGRTDWDRDNTLAVNARLKYYFCNEILRESFYTGAWSVAGCRRHSLFLSQGFYPIKGLHLVIPMLAQLRRRYPDLSITIAGSPPVTHKSAVVRAGVRFFFEYQTYCQKLMKQYDLADCVTYTGPLSEEQMKQQYLAANVFLSCSTMENESNSISEAKMLGVPVVSSCVGGVTERICHGVDGYFYPLSEPERAGYYIAHIFDDDALAAQLGTAAHEAAVRVNDREKNLNALLAIYEDIRANADKEERA